MALREQDGELRREALTEPGSISIRGLTKIFGRRQAEALALLGQGKSKDEILAATRATVGIHDVGFDVQRGEIFVVMGLSGSGKSTLVRCLNRLIRPTQGSVFIGGDDVTAMGEKELRELRLHRVSMVFQQFALLPHLSVRDNVAYGLRVRGMRPAERTEKSDEMLRWVGLTEWGDNSLDELSGGMQQRVGLARALATDPDVLLMDEPFSALDPLIRRDMQDELSELHAGLSKTIVFITHDLDEALKLGDRIAVMKDGLVHQIGSPEEILRTPATDYVAEFVDGVNPWAVITAEHVMDPVTAVVLVSEGPRVALRRMRRDNLSSIFVVDSNRRLLGLLTADNAAKAREADSSDIGQYMETDVQSVGPDLTLEELVPLGAQAEHPLPVVAADGRVRGVVVRSTILHGLTSQHGRSRRSEE